MITWTSCPWVLGDGAPGLSGRDNPTKLGELGVPMSSYEEVAFDKVQATVTITRDVPQA